MRPDIVNQPPGDPGDMVPEVYICRRCCFLPRLHKPHEFLKSYTIGKAEYIVLSRNIFQTFEKNMWMELGVTLVRNYKRIVHEYLKLDAA